MNPRFYGSMRHEAIWGRWSSMGLVGRGRWKRKLMLEAAALAGVYGASVGLACACPSPPHAAVKVEFCASWQEEAYVEPGVKVKLTAGDCQQDFTYDPDDIPAGVQPWPSAGITWFLYEYSKDAGAWQYLADAQHDPQPWPVFTEPGKYLIKLTAFDDDGQSATDTCTVYVIRITLTEPSFLPLGSPLEPPPTSHDVSYTCTIVPSSVPASARQEIEVWMEYRSGRPGYCCNSTQEVQGYLHDYRFYLTRNPNWVNQGEQTGQKLGKGAAGISETVTLTSRDYGGYGRMMAKVKIKGDWYYAVCSRDVNRSSARVPRDDDYDDISDAWPYDIGISEDDSDPNPGGAICGDGLERYEEYRGFLIQGTHVRTNPNDKDLFVYDEDGLGLEYATQIGFTIHSILDGEWSGVSSRKINQNENNGQCAVRMLNGGSYPSEPDRLGDTSWSQPKPHSPNNTIRVKIYMDNINALMTRYPGLITQADVLRIKKDAIAHEIGHAVDMEHCEDFYCYMHTPLSYFNPPMYYCAGCSAVKRLY
jgi:hypothetical protein